MASIQPRAPSPWWSMRTLPRRRPCSGSWTSRREPVPNRPARAPNAGLPTPEPTTSGTPSSTARHGVPSRRGFDTLVAAHLGGTALSYKGRARIERGQGHVEISSADLRPTLVELGLLPPPTVTAPSATVGTSPMTASAALQGDLSWNGPVFGLRHLEGRFAGTGGRGRPQPRLHTAEARPARRASGAVRAAGSRATSHRIPVGSRLGITGRRRRPRARSRNLVRSTVRSTGRGPAPQRSRPEDRDHASQRRRDKPLRFRWSFVPATAE